MDRSIIGMGIILILIWARPALAQQLSLTEVDRVTYELYQQKNWDDLVTEGNKALNYGIDYYYLRVRLGIAYYEKQNFHLAAKHLEKALEMNSSEVYVEEYLYYSYLLAGRQDEALLVASGFSPDLKRKTATDKQTFIEGLDLSYNYTSITKPEIIDNFTADVPLDRDGAQFIPNQQHYFLVGLQHRFSPRISFYHGYSNLQISHLTYTQVSSETFTDNDFKSDLNQYYAALRVLIAKGLSLSGGLHFVNSSYQATTSTTSGSGNSPIIRSVTSRVSNNDFVGFISLEKRFEYITLGAGYYRGSIADFIQNQTDFKLFTYPLGNLNLYTLTTASYQNQDFKDGNVTNRVLLDQQVGLKTTDWLWLEGYATFGEMDNFFLKDGLVIYNRMDVVKQRLGGRLILLPNPKWKITLDYTYLSNQSQFIQTPFTGEDYNIKKYQLHSLTATTSWKF
ncbi:hypothetical protein [Algoriphagus sp. CAU 1675]|uniref:tetratricopeptide repeat protein n=1 Tax=Algoriphagus sp. CAU 1675 TaxID=3032597 RepID=UPI0023DC8383|nr:hypothetical protein [Algoriphagus sp. CAU 1675]MDF2157715.1 hypothetical protein [Algoriphagus sp. CAU 1675]